MEDIETPESFDADYVKSLRQEAAKYRQQAKELKSEIASYKGLEAQVQQVRIENELVRRGIEADPAWVSLDEGQSPADAVENFLKKYPQFSLGGPEPLEVFEPGAKNVPKAMPPKAGNANVSGPAAKGSFGHRALSEIKEDPVARQTLRETYRALLAQGSHQENLEY